MIVTLTVDFGPAAQPPFENKATVPEQSTVLEVLAGQRSIATSPRYGMEHFIEEIDGIKNDFVEDLGWRFEVNGLRCNVPAERYLVKNGDWVKWLYGRGSAHELTREALQKMPSGPLRSRDSAIVKQIILVTGGARSGKSKYAEQRAGELGRRRLYVATAEARDEEMAHRIAEHKERRAEDWRTIEEPVELAAVLLAERGRTDCALVDCVTLWLSNLLLRHDAEFAARKVEELVAVLPRLNFSLVLVTNEVGWGIVPINPLARQFRDFAGWANQQVAAVADEVVLTVAGIPMLAKKST